MNSGCKFDFDYWAKLQQDNPEIFEVKRKQAIDEYIDSASKKNRKKLLGLQFTIDLTRSKSKQPMGSCIRLNQMMLNKVSTLDIGDIVKNNVSSDYRKSAGQGKRDKKKSGNVIYLHLL